MTQLAVFDPTSGLADEAPSKAATADEAASKAPQAAGQPHPIETAADEFVAAVKDELAKKRFVGQLLAEIDQAQRQVDQLKAKSVQADSELAAAAQRVKDTRDALESERAAAGMPVQISTD